MDYVGNIAFFNLLPHLIDLLCILLEGVQLVIVLRVKLLSFLFVLNLAWSFPVPVGFDLALFLLAELFLRRSLFCMLKVRCQGLVVDTHIVVVPLLVVLVLCVSFHSFSDAVELVS